MASHPHDLGRASVLPLSAVLGAIPSYPRPVIERLVARLIDQLDEQDGDFAVEPNGDELDGLPAEDDWLAEGTGINGVDTGPGCPFSDPPELEDAGGEGRHDDADQRIAHHGGGGWIDS